MADYTLSDTAQVIDKKLKACTQEFEDYDIEFTGQTTALNSKTRLKCFSITGNGMNMYFSDVEWKSGTSLKFMLRISSSITMSSAGLFYISFKPNKELKMDLSPALYYLYQSIGTSMYKSWTNANAFGLLMQIEYITATRGLLTVGPWATVIALR